MPYPNYFPRGVSMYVATAEYAVDVDIDNKFETLEYGTLQPLNTAGVLASVLMVSGAVVAVTAGASAAGATAIGNFGLLPGNSTANPGWGRNVTLVASISANTRAATVTGTDYLGQKMVEVITVSGTAAVSGKKAFAYVDAVSFATGTDTSTVLVGYGNAFGIPFTGESMISEIKNGAASVSAGTFTAGLVSTTAATNTSADSRGTYTPAGTIPDGTNTFKIIYAKRGGNLHGIAQSPS